jgi:hypothetical protein
MADKLFHSSILASTQAVLDLITRAPQGTTDHSTIDKANDLTIPRGNKGES